MRQSMKSRVWQSLPLMPAGHRGEAWTAMRLAEEEQLHHVRQIKPSGEYIPRPGS
ncbi:hypothetical protein J25TS5_48670 [Paenibacillus faecis]|uniref:hypothetical protein n=1 Tax=Paenibacillus faecis TaxID=862114 RepID=UPI001B17D302|nr:hypothetical protein [Paenibacillus faecis]GIO87935.1 hypothetical protein J25TS5_48670 [Paenibacillus faecis]